MLTSSDPAQQEPAIAPIKTSLLDYVVLGKNVLSPEHCQRLIERFEASETAQACRHYGGHSFTQLEITTEWPDENALLLPIFLDHFKRYQQLTRAFYWPALPAQAAFEHLRIKRYLPNGQDFFGPHVDVVNQLSARRFITAFIYLYEPEGGETVFSNLGLSIAPETGKLLMFPPLRLFPHEGRPSRAIPKYILHTYLATYHENFGNRIEVYAVPLTIYNEGNIFIRSGLVKDFAPTLTTIMTIPRISAPT